MPDPNNSEQNEGTQEESTPADLPSATSFDDVTAVVENPPPELLHHTGEDGGRFEGLEFDISVELPEPEAQANGTVLGEQAMATLNSLPETEQFIRELFRPTAGGEDDAMLRQAADDQRPTADRLIPQAGDAEAAAIIKSEDSTPVSPLSRLGLSEEDTKAVDELAEHGVPLLPPAPGDEEEEDDDVEEEPVAPAAGTTETEKPSGIHPAWVIFLGVVGFSIFSIGFYEVPKVLRKVDGIAFEVRKISANLDFGIFSKDARIHEVYEEKEKLSIELNVLRLSTHFEDQAQEAMIDKLQKENAELKKENLKLTGRLNKQSQKLAAVKRTAQQEAATAASAPQ